MRRIAANASDETLVSEIRAALDAGALYCAANLAKDLGRDLAEQIFFAPMTRDDLSAHQIRHMVATLEALLVAARSAPPMPSAD